MRYVVVVIGLLAVPFAFAGTASDPEVTDSGSDATATRPGMDVTKVWVESVDLDTDPKLMFMVETVGDFQHTAAFFALQEIFRIGFKTDTLPSGVAEYYAHVRPTCVTVVVVTSVPDCRAEDVNCRFGRPATVGGFQELTQEEAIASVFPSGNTMGCVVPWASLAGFGPGSRIVDLYLTHEVVSRGPVSNGDTVPPRVLLERDRAPDTGFGRIYIAPGGELPEPTGPVIEWIDVNAEAFATTINFGDAEDRIRIHNWTAAAGDFYLNHTITATAGTVNITVTDGNGTVHLTCPCDGASRFIQDVPEGTWNITVAMAGFTGNVTVTVEPAPEGSEPPTTTTTASGTSTGTTTSDGTPQGNTTSETSSDAPVEDSPGVGILALLTGLVVALATRRR